MKAKFFYMFIFVFTITSVTYRAYSNDCPQNPLCYGNSCNCQEWSPWEERMEPIDMGAYGFPQCTLWVWYCYRQCVEPGKEHCVEIKLQIAQAALPYCGQCDGFIEWLTQDDEWTQARRLRNVFNYFFRRIVLITWFRFLEGVQQEFWPYCDEGQPRRKFTYWMASCRGYCMTQYPIGQPNIRLLITLKDCTESYCCGREIELCVDRETGQTIIETRRLNPPIECPTIRVPLSECPPGSNVISTYCIDNCEDVE